jgi:glucose-fructose oxidoreductase
MTDRIWRIAGINFDHMHMGDHLRLADEAPNAEIVGVCHSEPERMASTVSTLSIPPDRVFTNPIQCLEATRPDIVVLCPRTADHARYVEMVAPFGTTVVVEKPMAACLADADRMITAMQTSGQLLAINWPLAWYPPHQTTRRLITEGAIGDVIEVHYYDGNRGPLRHVADKIEVSAAEAAAQKNESWWYKREACGGSLQDYLGYGVTLGTWFVDGRAPIEVTCVVDEPPGLEVDEHSITIARYAFGLSRFETRWGTYTDPWTHQPQPKCGFVVVGTRGTISSYDYEPTILLQDETHPEGIKVQVDTPAPQFRDPLQHIIHCLETGAPLHGPLDPTLCRIGQQIVDTAVLSAREKRTIPLAQ